ncbi:MAG: flagellar hook protein FlgE [Gammaproteobacteria bacterium]|nr:flagellar hook protein FlgE [Gammaproteobacteria bacterium]MBU1646171.1 flagellar hook protein FlgE [Gammaproteobacteria bacterium]MBU1972233.1 flagellar hook protein FlgE [Gammaproteobacteria bacterium]
MGFQQGLSGLNAASKALDSVGNNIANSGTVGFKSSNTQFGDVYAATLGGGSQVGIGVTVGGISQQFTQGNVTVSNNPLDIAINGQGMFRLNNNGTITWTRNGQFNIDKNGFVVNSSGYRLTGYIANAANVIVPSTPADIYINTSDLQPQPTGNTGGGVTIGLNLDSRSSTFVPNGSLTGSAGPNLVIGAGNDGLVGTVDGVAFAATIPNATYLTAGALAAAVQGVIAGVTVSVNGTGQLVITSNTTGTTSSVVVSGGSGATDLLGTAPASVTGSTAFNASDPTTYTSSTSATVYDSLGNSHLLSMFFRKTGANTWDAYSSLNGGTATAATPLTFSSTGALTSPPAGIIAQTFPVTTGALPLAFSLNLTGSTQYGNIFGVNAINQDGYTSGRLAGLSISADGTVQGRYSNGQTRDLGQVVLGNFNNPNGLTSLGNNQWSETADSGQPLVGVPGSGSLGALQSAAIEESNVDLTAELVSMITQQRAYQANAQTIKTQDQVLQTLVNLR